MKRNIKKENKKEKNNIRLKTIIIIILIILLLFFIIILRPEKASKAVVTNDIGNNFVVENDNKTILTKSNITEEPGNTIETNDEIINFRETENVKKLEQSQNIIKNKNEIENYTINNTNETIENIEETINNEKLTTNNEELITNDEQNDEKEINNIFDTNKDSDKEIIKDINEEKDENIKIQDNVQEDYKEDDETKEIVEEIEKKEYITGKIITENINEVHKANVIVYKTSDKRPEDIESIRHEDGSINEEVRQPVIMTQTEDDGTFCVQVINNQKYDLLIEKDGYLSYRITEIDIIECKSIQLEEYKLIAGNVVKYNTDTRLEQIEVDDLVDLRSNIGIVITEDNKKEKNKYDLNEDGIIDKLDVNILKKNYDKQEERIIWSI